MDLLYKGAFGPRQEVPLLFQHIATSKHLVSFHLQPPQPSPNYKKSVEHSKQSMQLSLLTPFLLLSTTLYAAPTPQTPQTPQTPHPTITQPTPSWQQSISGKQAVARARYAIINFLVSLNGCTVMPKGCASSAKITTASDGCDGEFFS